MDTALLASDARHQQMTHRDRCSKGFILGVVVTTVIILVDCAFMGFLHWAWLVCVASVVVMFLPNIVTWFNHGTADLLRADGHSIDSWASERQQGFVRSMNEFNNRNTRSRLLDTLVPDSADEAFLCALCLQLRPSGSISICLPCSHRFCTNGT
eukprot:TRINITY_DN11950_c0_g1_i1.p1 TRINITY_DN11950_c0_g1~~TRINITY_DN11950_c0_g1_i1.p1  ORF type:complete len:175 (-),score=8.80 TRINITY_DN11950_c0_g1_i1:78-539(-)